MTPFLRSDLARFTVVGDGPERNRLEQLTRSLGIAKAVFFCGWLSHAKVLKHLRSADVFVFPSLRDNGAGVVFEARSPLVPYPLSWTSAGPETSFIQTWGTRWL
jgi:glycosyltransferase involved in cell wall biosynthesis